MSKSQCEQLQGALELLRALGSRGWKLHKVKRLLRSAGVLVPRPRAAPAELTQRAIAAARRGETVEVGLDEL